MATSSTSSGTLYRITTPTIALVPEEGKSVAQRIPAGALVTIADPTRLMNDHTGPGLGLLEVQWEFRPVLMFARDVRERSERVEDDGVEGC